jgi:hypothetical protein
MCFCAGGLRSEPQAHLPALPGREIDDRKRSGRKRALGIRAPMLLPMAANMRWSLDFVSDQMTSDRRFRILCVVDDCTRER